LAKLEEVKDNFMQEISITELIKVIIQKPKGEIMLPETDLIPLYQKK
jgi:hypothetical protein